LRVNPRSSGCKIKHVH